MPSAIVPATPGFDAAGTPYSPEYGDVYHSDESGPGQALHVFLGGNDLPQKWSGARLYTILETGFGLGLNFLATWQAWRNDAGRPARLHFVSIEKHPFTREGLAALHGRYSELAPLAGELQAAWPLALPGLHRLEFEGGHVTLTLALGDVARVLPQLRLAADAFYLDGFAPGRNPEMWTPAVMKALSRLARPGATLATYTAARAVRDALSAAGFEPELRPGFGSKRDMLVARHALHRGQPAAPNWSERRAMVIGAGLAGAAVSERLAARGWKVELIERHEAPATEASGIPGGVLHPHVSRDDSILSRLTRAGYLYALTRWRVLEAAGLSPPWSRCGVVQMAKDEREETRMAETARALGFPPTYFDYVTRSAAGIHAGRNVGAGGWWFPDSGHVRPAGLVAAQLQAARPNLVLHTGVAVHELFHNKGMWIALKANGTFISMAPVVVLANSHEAALLAPSEVPLKRVRGQLTRLLPGSVPGLRTVLAGPGSAIPMVDGGVVVGATFDYDDDNPNPRLEGHTGNLERLRRLLPETDGALCDSSPLEGDVGFRCVSADRLPLIGAMPDGDKTGTRGIRTLPGLYGAFAYGSRGLTWAALGGELIASLVEGEPLPVEADLAGAVDPGRFLLRRARRSSR